MCCLRLLECVKDLFIMVIEGQVTVHNCDSIHLLQLYSVAQLGEP